MIAGLVVFEGEPLRIRLEEKVEWVQHRHFRDEVHFDQELAGFFGENQPRMVVGLRVLLPVDEMLLGRDAQRVAQDARARVWSGPQPNDLRPERHQPVVPVMRPMMECDVDRHG